MCPVELWQNYILMFIKELLSRALFVPSSSPSLVASLPDSFVQKLGLHVLLLIVPCLNLIFLYMLWSPQISLR